MFEMIALGHLFYSFDFPHECELGRMVTFYSGIGSTSLNPSIPVIEKKQ